MIPALLGAALAFGVAALWWIGRPRGPGQSGDLRLHPVAPDVWMFRGYFSNAVALVLPTRVVVVDTLISPQTARMMRDAVARLTSKPITHVILTHYHGDHVGGLEAFADAEVIASEETARLILERDHERRDYVEAFGMVAHGYPAVPPPSRTFAGDLSLDLDGERLEIRHLGAVETTDAHVVWWPARGVICVGDGVSTAGYPYLGAPVADEGLRDDGAWIGFLERVEALGPAVLVAGHGPALLGRARIAERLGLLRSLMADVVTVTKAERAAGGTPEEIAARALPRLERYAEHPDLTQNVTTQRFAVFRVLNSLDPTRRGRGWWADYRTPLLQAEGPDPIEAAGWAALADRMLAAMIECDSVVDGSDFFKEAGRAARAALALEPDQPVARLILGIIEVWSAVLLGQPMDPGRAHLEAALASGRLDAGQARKARFFLGKACQYTLDDPGADRWLRRALPWWLRPAYPLLRPRLRSVP